MPSWLVTSEQAFLYCRFIDIIRFTIEAGGCGGLDKNGREIHSEGELFGWSTLAWKTAK